MRARHCVSLTATTPGSTRGHAAIAERRVSKLRFKNTHMDQQTAGRNAQHFTKIARQNRRHLQDSVLHGKTTIRLSSFSPALLAVDPTDSILSYHYRVPAVRATSVQAVGRVSRKRLDPLHVGIDFCE